MVRNWRVILLVCMLAFGVIGIGATSHFGMTLHGAMAAITVASPDVAPTDLCMLHCLVAHDVPVSDGMLAVAFVVFAIVAAAFLAQSVSRRLVPRAYFARYNDPGLLLTVCKRE